MHYKTVKTQIGPELPAAIIKELQAWLLAADGSYLMWNLLSRSLLTLIEAGVFGEQIPYKCKAQACCLLKTIHTTSLDR